MAPKRKGRRGSHTFGDQRHGPNPEGSYGRKSFRHDWVEGQKPSRAEREKIPDELLQDLRRRIAEVKLAEVIRAAEDADKPMDLAAVIKEASKKKYGGLIEDGIPELIHNDTNKFINQLGIDPADIKVGDKLPSVSDLRGYVRNSLNNVQTQVGKLNKYLYPDGIPLNRIIASIHFGHAQGLGAGGPNYGDVGLAQMPKDNVTQGQGSGPSKGALDDTGRFKVHDTFSAIGHPQFWDEVLSNFISGRKSIPVQIELTPEGRNKVIHQGYDPDRVMIEEGEIKLRDAITGEPKVKIDPAAEANPLHDYGKHQQKVLESSQERALKPQVQQVVEHKPTSTMQDTKMLNEWLVDQAVDGRYKPQTTEVGRPLGGLPSKINLTGRLLKGLPIPIVGAAMSELDVAQRQEDYNRSGNIVDKTQLGIANIGKAGEYLSSYSAAAYPAVAEDPYAVIPAAGMAIGEGIGVVSELANTTIDFGEAVYNAGQDLVNWLNREEN